MTEHTSLAAALAGFQANLPAVHKNATGQVPGKGKSKYADLANLSAVVLPELAKHGLSWLTMPGFDDNGNFVLQYELLHTSGEARKGSYPLPSGTAWEIGSAISYGRRYCLSAVTGVAADEDDDGATANDAGPARQQRQRPRQVHSAEAAPDTVGQARADLAAFAQEEGLQLPVVDAEYAKRSGKGLVDETDPEPIRAFLVHLREDPKVILSDAPKVAA